MTWLTILLTFYAGSCHPLHISLTSIEFNEHESQFVIACKIFTDDMESVVRKKYGIEMNLGKENENSEYRTYINKYVQEHLSFQVNGKDMDQGLEFLKREMNYEAVWFYYKVNCDTKIKSVKIKSSFLNDLYPDQKNLVIFNYGKINKGFQFKAGDEEEEIVL